MNYILLYRLGEDEEDRSLAGKAANSDNVALMTLLQPWQDSEHPSGACVVCTQLHDEQGHSGDAVRVLQACGLTRTIEAFNSDFHLPVILCGTMNCLPSSGAYEILCRGLEAQDPSRPGPPGKPLVEPLSTSSAHLRWAVPQDDHEALNPLIDLYKLLWIPGGSRFLLGEGVAVPEADCLVYDLVETKSGNVRSEQNRLRSFIATGLSSGIAYEFRVAAVNALGQGPWSERSEPVHMPRIAGNDPEYGVLLGAASIKLVRERELEEVRRRAEERLADPRAYQLRKLVKIAGLLDVGAENLHPFDSVSGMTPRYSDAVLHPDSANVRTDTGFPSIIPSTLGDNSSNVSSVTTGRRRRRKEKGAPDESYGTHSTGDKNTSNTEEWNSDAKSEDASGSAPRADGCRKELKPSSHRHTTTDASPEESGSCRAASYAKSVENGTKPSRWLDHAPPCAPLVSECGASEEGGVPEAYFGREKKLLLRLAALNVSGKRSSRQKHALGLRSAYMSHCSGGEPAFTALSDKFSGTVDYIFFSAACLLPEGVLSLPEIGSLVGQDVQQTELAPIPGLWVPKKWQAEHTKEGYTGEWSPLLRENPLKVRHKIPNDVFPSDHLMLMANLVYFEPRCPSTWR